MVPLGGCSAVQLAATAVELAVNRVQPANEPQHAPLGVEMEPTISNRNSQMEAEHLHTGVEPETGAYKDGWSASNAPNAPRQPK